MINLSDKQEEMLAFIENFVVQNGYPPTREEIRNGLDISTKSLVNYHLEALESADFLKRVPNTPRGLRLTRENRAQSKAVSGKVKDRLKIPEFKYSDSEILELTYGAVTNDSNLLALKVEGNIITDGAAYEGDIVILQRQNQAQNGELVIVRSLESQKLMLKRYYRENGHVRLLPARTNIQPLILKAGAVEVQGKVVAIIRQFDNEETVG